MNLEVYIRPLVKGESYPLIELPPKVAEQFLQGKNRRRVIISFSNGKELHRAIQRHKNGFCFITLGKATLKEGGVEAGTTQTVKIVEDNSRFGMPVPEELEEVLRQDPEGEQRFLELKPGVRRSFLYYINSAKTIDTRINRSLKLIENLKMGIISAGDYVSER